MKYCTNCQTERESRYERYGSGSDSQCWYCDRYTLAEAVYKPIVSNTISCGQRASTYSSGTNYCQYSGCFTQSNIINGYCSAHSSQRSSTGWGYSYSSSGSICQAEDCSRRTSLSSENYCQVCKPIQALNRQVESRTNISSPVKDTVEFATWWNNNLATVVNGNSSFTIYLLVYDGSSGIKPFQSSLNSYNLSNAKSQASTSRTNLNGNNPILYIHPKANSYGRFEDIVNHNSYNNAFVVKVDLWNAKPLDVIKVEKKDKAYGIPFYHVGVYLGNNQVCHVYDYAEEKWMEPRITGISTFLGDTSTTRTTGSPEVYHPVIPFKHYKKIAQQIDWAESSKFRRGNYDLFNRNCEHFANMCVYGIDYSEQIGKLEADGLSHFLAKYGKDKNMFVQIVLKPWWWKGIIDVIEAHKRTSNNGKGSTINLANEIVETNSRLGERNDYQAQQLERTYRDSVPAKVSWL